jgi:hypothetical protein
LPDNYKMFRHNTPPPHNSCRMGGGGGGGAGVWGDKYIFPMLQISSFFDPTKNLQGGRRAAHFCDIYRSWVQNIKYWFRDTGLLHIYRATQCLTMVLPQNTTQKSISIVFCVSAIRHDSSLSKYRKQKQSPPWKYRNAAIATVYYIWNLIL